MSEENKALQRRLDAANTRLAAVDSRARQTWVYPQSPPNAFVMRRILVSASNNLALGYGGLTGAKYTATPITTAAPLTTAYNPSAPVAITDNGIAYGVDLDSANAPCLIFNAPVQIGSVTYGNILTFDLPQTCMFLAWRQIAVPVAGPTTVLAWEAYWA